MSKPFYFHYQVGGKESKWDLAIATERDKVVRELQPAFCTVLDLSSVPDDNDWTKVRYRGPFYADFDADGDLDRVIDQFGVFLGKLDTEFDLDVTQAHLFASGGKGFHIEIPAECFQVKVPEQGTTWLPYIYRAMAEATMVDTLDLNVYTGKKGRQWRTTNVKRDNGNYKVSISLEEALSMTPDLYAEVIKAPRAPQRVTPPVVNTKFSMLFERSKEKIHAHMRGKKKRQQTANAILDPWKQMQMVPPTIQALMDGENVAEGVGFQRIAMQLAIYATSTGMDEHEFLQRCAGLVEKHQGDGWRYQGAEKRRRELSRMWAYMAEDSLYDFEVGPIVKLLVKGTSCPDLGILDLEDHADAAPSKPRIVTDEAGNQVEVKDSPSFDIHKSLRRGFIMNGDGMFSQSGDNTLCLCRASLRDVEAYFDVEDGSFRGYEFTMHVAGHKDRRTTLESAAFTSAASMRKFFAAHQLTYQGSDAETAALMDTLSEKADRSKRRTYVYPREGLFVLDHPEHDDPKPVVVYLTQDQYITAIDEGDDDFFRLKYKPNQAASAYNIDIHRAPALGPEHVNDLHDLFSLTKPEVLADLIGWFAACHYRSFYHREFKQFPLLQVYGEAGAGKSQTVRLMAHLHWYRDDLISMKSAASCTPFAMDMHASSSTSAPFILDEYKPRELKRQGAKHEKIKDVLKAAYIMGDIGERGTLNKGAETALAIVKSRATAPIVFMGEAIEIETAIIERAVTVRMSKSYLTNRRKRAFERLQANPVAICALGRAIVEAAFSVDLPTFAEEVTDIKRQVEESLPEFDDKGRKRPGERPIYNRTVIIHGLSVVRRVLQSVYGTEFDETIDMMQGARRDMGNPEDARLQDLYARSEITKVMSRVALLSRASGFQYELAYGKDYLVGDGWVEVKVERAYDCYRQYSASINDTALFDTLDAFVQALFGYHPMVDANCISSELRDGSSETIMRFDSAALQLEGVQQFRC